MGDERLAAATAGRSSFRAVPGAPGEISDFFGLGIASAFVVWLSCLHTTTKGTAMNTTTTTTGTKFEIGEQVSTRSLCNWDCIFRFEVVGRTAKFVTLHDGDKARRVGIKTTQDGREYALPFGNYSMSATVYAGERVD